MLLACQDIGTWHSGNGEQGQDEQNPGKQLVVVLSTVGCYFRVETCTSGEWRWSLVPLRHLTLSTLELQTKVHKYFTITEKAPTRAFSLLKSGKCLIEVLNLIIYYDNMLNRLPNT